MYKAEEAKRKKRRKRVINSILVVYVEVLMSRVARRVDGGRGADSACNTDPGEDGRGNALCAHNAHPKNARSLALLRLACLLYACTYYYSLYYHFTLHIISSLCEMSFGKWRVSLA